MQVSWHIISSEIMQMQVLWHISLEIMQILSFMAYILGDNAKSTFQNIQSFEAMQMQVSWHILSWNNANSKFQNLQSSELMQVQVSWHISSFKMKANSSLATQFLRDDANSISCHTFQNHQNLCFIPPKNSFHLSCVPGNYVYACLCEHTHPWIW